MKQEKAGIRELISLAEMLFSHRAITGFSVGWEPEGEKLWPAITMTPNRYQDVPISRRAKYPPVWEGWVPSEIQFKANRHTQEDIERTLMRAGVIREGWTLSSIVSTAVN